MTIKYLQNTTDTRDAIYEVDFKAHTFRLIKCLGDRLPDLKGKFKKGGFASHSFKEVKKPV